MKARVLEAYKMPWGIETKMNPFWIFATQVPVVNKALDLYLTALSTNADWVTAHQRKVAMHPDVKRKSPCIEEFKLRVNNPEFKHQVSHSGLEALEDPFVRPIPVYRIDNQANQIEVEISGIFLGRCPADSVNYRIPWLGSGDLLEIGISWPPHRPWWALVLGLQLLKEDILTDPGIPNEFERKMMLAELKELHDLVSPPQNSEALAAGVEAEISERARELAADEKEFDRILQAERDQRLEAKRHEKLIKAIRDGATRSS